MKNADEQVEVPFGQMELPIGQPRPTCPASAKRRLAWIRDFVRAVREGKLPDDPERRQVVLAGLRLTALRTGEAQG